MARRKIPPMPIEAIADNQKLAVLPIAGYGMVLRILIHFWANDCRVRPTTDNMMYAWSHAHRPTWMLHRLAIKDILAELLPELEKHWLWRQAKLDSLARMRDRGASITRLRTMAKKAGDVNGVNIAPRIADYARKGKEPEVKTERQGFAD